MRTKLCGLPVPCFMWALGIPSLSLLQLENVVSSAQREHDLGYELL